MILQYWKKTKMHSSSCVEMYTKL